MICYYAGVHQTVSLFVIISVLLVFLHAPAKSQSVHDQDTPVPVSVTDSFIDTLDFYQNEISTDAGNVPDTSVPILSDTVTAPDNSSVLFEEHEDISSGAGPASRLPDAVVVKELGRPKAKNGPQLLTLIKKRIFPEKSSREIRNMFAGTLVKLVIIIALIIAMWLIIITIIARREKNRFLTTTRLSIMDKEVQKACRYIEKNYDSPDLDVNEICEALVTGPAFLEALFERELGMNVERFIEQVRINHAKIYFQNNSGMSVSEIAGMAGFDNVKNFEHTFESISGISWQTWAESAHKE